MKRKKLISLILGIIFAGLAIFSGIKIILWKIDSNNTDSAITKVQEETEIKEEDNNDAEVVLEENLEPENIYWKYLNTPLLSVDLSALKTENPDTVGWLRLEGTNVNYPFVQANDNKFYLSHSFSKNYNSAGWVFLDYRNSKKFDDKNSIIYAHGRTDKTMFGSLHNLLKNDWRSNPDNYLIRLVTDNFSAIYQIFSVYVIPTTSDYLRITFNTDDEFKEFADILKNRSGFDFKTNINTNDKILTLSTCYNNDKKIVVHAKLIKYLYK